MLKYIPFLLFLAPFGSLFWKSVQRAAGKLGWERCMACNKGQGGRGRWWCEPWKHVALCTSLQFGNTLVVCARICPRSRPVLDLVWILTYMFFSCWIYIYFFWSCLFELLLSLSLNLSAVSCFTFSRQIQSHDCSEIFRSKVHDLGNHFTSSH